MSLQRFRLLVIPALALVLCAASVEAREIYKWVAKDGSTHYGEILPETEVAGFEVLQVVPAEPARAAQDYRSTLELADSLQAARLARERLRLERERLRLERSRLQEEQESWNESAEPYYIPPYPGYGYRPYRRPPHGGHHPWYPAPRPGGGYPRPYQVPKRVYTPDR